MKHFQSKVLTAAILAALSGSAIAATEVYEKSEVDTKIDAAKTEVTNTLTSKIDTAKNELETKLTAQNESGKEDIKKIKAAVVKITKSLMGEEGNDENPGVFGALQDLNTSVESNKSEIGKLTTDLADAKIALGKTDTKANEAVKTANEAKQVAEKAKQVADETKQSIDTKVKAAEAAAGKAEAAAGKAEAAAAKVTDVEKDANAAWVEAHNNALAINGFKVGDTLYDIDENGEITSKKAEQADVDEADFDGMGLKNVLAKTAEVVDQHTDNLAAVKTAIDDTRDDVALLNEDINGFKVGDTIYDIDENGKITKKEATEDDVKADDFGGLGLKEVVKANKAAIATKADKTELEKVSDKVTANETAIGKKANSADVYTKAQSDERFVKVENSIGGLDTTTKGLDTRLTSAEKSITEHGTRLNGLDKTVSDLRKETRQGLAEQAALSGLFQPYNVGRFNVTAAVGGYKSESAVAIGTGFRFTENFAAKAGVAVGTSSGSSAAYHVGVNYEW